MSARHRGAIEMRAARGGGPRRSVWGLGSGRPLLEFMLLGASLFASAIVAYAEAPAPADSLIVARADSLLEQLDANRIAEVEAEARRWLVGVETAYGRESLEAAQVLDVIASALVRAGKVKSPEAKELWERALRIQEGVFGPDRPQTAWVMGRLANLMIESGDYASARPLLERVLRIREKELGPEHPELAKALGNLGELNRRAGDYPAAVSALERATRILEAALGPNHPDVAKGYDNLGIVYTQMGDYSRAEPLLERGLEIRIEALGPEHPQVGRSLGNLTNVVLARGNYARARELSERVIPIFEKSLGVEHPLAGKACTNLGNVLGEIGEFAEARRAYERGLAILEKALGADHPEVGLTLGNLGQLLSHMGDDAGARGLLERSLSIKETKLGPEHPSVGLVLDHLGGVLLQLGDYAASQERRERAIAIFEKTLGPDAPEVGTTLGNLGQTLQRAGKESRAGECFERSLAILEQALGPEHPDVARSLLDLATARAATGNHGQARRLRARAVEIATTSLGPDHPLVAASLAALSGSLRALGENRAALDAALQAETISREHLRLTARTLPERQALGVAAVRTLALDRALSLAATGATPTAADVARIWDATIRSRALVLDEMASRHRPVSADEDSTVAPLGAAYAAAKRRFAALLVRGAHGEPPERYRALLDEARRESEAAEEALAERSTSFRKQQGRDRTGLEQVERALPPGSILVAYVNYVHFEPDRGGSPDSMRSKERPAAAAEKRARYGAFVLGGPEAEPAFVPLGDAAEIDALVLGWRKQVVRGAEGGEASQLESACREAGETLRQRIWDPLQPRLRGAQRAFIVPDATLYLVNVAALPAADGRYLLESGLAFHGLTAERDLAPAERSVRQGKGLLAMGAPDFEAPEKSSNAAAGRENARSPTSSAPEAAANRDATRGVRRECEGFSTVRFSALPSSEREVREIVALWKEQGSLLVAGRTSSAEAGRAEELTRDAAGEAAFKARAPGKRLLHLATHGFFLGGGCFTATEAARGVGGLKQVQEIPAASPSTGKNLLHLSGLALAGANRRAAAPPEAEDGILTAEEIAAMDLGGVEWAVLSACDTGVGEVLAGEGVLGLRRAFEIAGANTLIMSLWSVADESTRGWMRALYEARLVGGKDTVQCVRDASLQVLAERRRTKQSTHPFFWGAFVAAGAWQ